MAQALRDLGLHVSLLTNHVAHAQQLSQTSSSQLSAVVVL